MLWQLLWLALGGLLVGSLGRLAVPDAQPRLLPLSLLLGLGGAIGGGLLTGVVLPDGHDAVSLVAGVVIATVLVFGLAVHQRARSLPSA